jgi:hypothetical protein
VAVEIRVCVTVVVWPAPAFPDAVTVAVSVFVTPALTVLVRVLVWVTV